MSHSERRDSILRAAIFGIITLIAVGLIVFLKQESDVPLTPEGIAHRDSISRFAVPDTATTPDEPTPLAPAESYPATPDSLSFDTRVPADAGYEDGYFAGIEDGLAGRERYSYDETSLFPTAQQRRNYAEAYRRGYKQGYLDGQHSADHEHHHDAEEDAEDVSPDTAPDEPGVVPSPQSPSKSPAPTKGASSSSKATPRGGQSTPKSSSQGHTQSRQATPKPKR